MLLVDDDEAKVGEGQKQGRARADDDLRPAAGRRSPDALTLALRQAGMPLGGPCAKARSEAVEDWAVSAISGKSTSAWRFCRKASAKASK